MATQGKTKSYWARLTASEAKALRVAARKRGLSRAALMALILRRWVADEASATRDVDPLEVR